MHQKDQNLGSKSIFVNMRRIRNHSYRSQGGGHLFIRLRTRVQILNAYTKNKQAGMTYRSMGDLEVAVPPRCPTQHG